MADTSDGFGSAFDSGASLDAVHAASDLSGTFDGLQSRTNSLALSTSGLARAMSQAFVGATSGGKQLDDVLKSLALRMSNLAVSAAFRPLASGVSNGLSQLFSGLFAGGTSNAANVAAAVGAIKPFAAGGVIGTPTYFPLAAGGLGLAGEAGPEAIVPLARGADGRLGVASSGGAPAATVTIHIATPDADSFRRSEVYLTGQIARAVARGQRGL
jgi:phage-related minor tail protein